MSSDNVVDRTRDSGWIAVCSVFALGIAILALLPAAAFVLAWYGFSGLSGAVQRATGSLFPFLFVEWDQTINGITTSLPITEHPFFLTLLQWMGIAMTNWYLAHAGLSRRPFASALALVCATSVVTAALVVGSNYHFAMMKT
jgi:hypothetical protein